MFLLLTMTAVIYTHPPDYRIAGISARALAAQGLKVIVAIDEKEPPFACDFATIVRTSFKRQGNLNGTDFILGNLALMLEHASGEYTFKIDSDTLLLNPAGLVAGLDAVAVGIWPEGMDGMYGACYALRTDAIPAIMEEVRKLPPSDAYMEDKTTGDCALQVGPCHFPRWGEKDSPFCKWKPSNPAEWYLERKNVVIFDLTESFQRDSIAREMTVITRALEALHP